MANASKKRKFVIPLNRWTDMQTKELLSAVLAATKMNSGAFEAPTSQQFYEKISKQSNSLQNLHWTKMKNKVRNLKTHYIVAVAWMDQKGTMLIEKGHDKEVEDYMQKTCPYYDILDELFSHQKGNFPVISAVRQSVFKGFDRQFDDELDDDDDDDDPFPEDLLGIREDEQLDEFPSDNSMMTNSTYETETENGITLLQIKEKRLRLEQTKFEKQFELEKQKLDLEREKLELRKLEMIQQMEIRKMEIARDERIALVKLKLEMEVSEKIKKYEIELKAGTK